VKERLLSHPASRRLAGRLPDPVRHAAKRVVSASDRARWGNLRRRQPFSERYGFDRGLPVDRHYIERFLARHAQDVRGRVLEVADARYTERFGGAAVEQSDVVDIDPDNVRASIVADLCEPGSLPASSFECLLITQTLQLLPDLDTGLGNAWRALAPGGVLLATVPSLSRVDRHLREVDLWRFTPRGFEQALRRACPDATALEVEGFGNLVTGIAFLLGLAAEELDAEELDYVDPFFPLLACARVQRAAA
jgi:SAM-dependent methyltransferase